MTDLLTQKNSKGVNVEPKNASDPPVMYPASIPPGMSTSKLAL